MPASSFHQATSPCRPVISGAGRHRMLAPNFLPVRLWRGRIAIDCGFALQFHARRVATRSGPHLEALEKYDIQALGATHYPWS